MTRSPTVLVVGGGATGVGVARDLALRDVDVMLVEQDGLGGGTSGRSHGLLHSGARYAESDPEGARECLAENRILREIAGACVSATDGLFVQLPADDPAYFRRKREACDALDIPTDELDGDEARALVPDLAEAVERALRVPDAVVSPSRLVAATAVDAADHGATIHTGTPLEALTVRGDRVAAARLGGAVDAVVEPEYVVNAAGAWAGEVAAMAGVEVPMAPTRGAMVSVEYAGLGPVLNRCRPPDDGDIIVPHEGEAVAGTTSVPVTGPEGYERADWEVETCLEECAEMLPPVASAERKRAWWGVRPLYAPEERDRERGISRGFHCLDHADEGIWNCVSVVGGKLTTYRRMAAATADLVCDRLGIERGSETADRSLPGHDDPAELDAYVARFDARNPTDADVVSGS